MDGLGHHLSEDERRAYRARSPDDTYKGGVRRFPRMIKIEEDMLDVEISKKSRHSLETIGTLVKDAVFVACGMQDPILGPHMKSLARVLRNGCHHAEIEDASHFVQVKSRSWRFRSLRTMAIPPSARNESRRGEVDLNGLSDVQLFGNAKTCSLRMKVHAPFLNSLIFGYKISRPAVTRSRSRT